MAGVDGVFGTDLVSFDLGNFLLDLLHTRARLIAPFSSLGS
jgi:hypothetical protein